MISMERSGGGLPLKALALGLGLWVFSGSSAPAWGQAPGPTPTEPSILGSLFSSKLGLGELGYGKPGLLPGFSGFGLGFHPGYGYGGSGLGVGAHGGYPYYGGPGYPHGEPRLRRFGPATPFPYYGGPGDSCYGPTHRYEATGPLVVDRPVARVDDPYEQDFGSYSGAIPYPETVFATYASAAAATGSSAGGVGSPSPTTGSGYEPETLLDRPSTSTSPNGDGAGGTLIQAAELGFEQEPIIEAGGVHVMKVTNVHPGTEAQKAGLNVGDLIHSINGYHTDQPGNLPWITANAAPDRVLKMIVRAAGDGKERTVSIQLP
ncbi:PDZ domain-containing protein [Paludisphaera borealis]|uniref:PDZ domain-containing protein n=1 Tax=Paludisphaera borealis TaxID=1387353 RepID=A0A1U7CXL0_9BACT|nr:PDZ domain-containing protein [Paludisphaera borealis]APW63690.1 hypothetical protein BSF38_05264 [Paludisphaera borealis]